MKRGLSFAVGTILLASSFFAALPAHAQSNTTIQPVDIAPVTGNDLIVTKPTLNSDGTVSTQTVNVPFTPSSSSGDNSATRNNPGGLDKQGSANDSGYDSIMTWIMRLFAWMVGVAAITLDNAVYYTVIHMGSVLNQSQGGLTAIGVAWRILRDIGNIILIFGFLAIGIATILNVQSYGARKMLPMLLISAVMLNFSLFIAEAVIDVGNLFATEFFVQINNGQMPSGPIDYSSTNVHNEGISNKIMAQVGLQTLYNANLPQNSSLLKSGNLWIVGFMAIILFLIAAFVMFSLAFVLIARFVFLIFLIVVAPVGFAGLAIPKLDKAANMWWSKLFEQTITAPVLLLMLYVALAVITDANFLTGFGVNQSSYQNAWTAFLNNGNGDVGALAGMMLAFLIAMGLLLAVTILSKQMSAFGASAATKWGVRFSGIGFAATSSAWVGRNTAGALGYRASKRIKGSALGRTALGRSFANSIENKVAKNSFDFRNSGFAKTASKTVGLQLEKAQKGGYKKEYEDSVKGYEQGARDTIKDRKQTREEATAIRETEAARTAAAQRSAAVQADRDAARRTHAGNQAELNDLKRAKEADKFWEADPENRRKLEEAERKAAESGETLADAETKLAAALGETTAAAEAAKKTKTGVEQSIKDDTKARREAYADRLGKVWGNRALNLAVFGSSRREAAANIRKNAGKSKDEIENDKLLKQLRKAAEKAEKGDSGGEEKEKKEEEH